MSSSWHVRSMSLMPYSITHLLIASHVIELTTGSSLEISSSFRSFLSGRMILNAVQPEMSIFWTSNLLLRAMSTALLLRTASHWS
jgi:hypothetical protein